MLRQFRGPTNGSTIGSMGSRKTGPRGVPPNPPRYLAQSETYPKRSRSTHGFVRLVYSLGFLLLSVNALAQSKSGTQLKERTTGESTLVVVDSVRIEGGTELSKDEQTLIADSLRGEVSHSDWLERLEVKATRQLQDDGFLDGTVAAKVESTKLLDGKRHVTVLVALTGNTRYLIQEVRWAGASIFSPAQLDDLSLLQVGDVFRHSALRKSMSVLHQAYGDRGYNEMYIVPQFQKFPEHGKVALYLEVVEGRSDERKHLQCRQYSIEDIQNNPYVPSPTYDPTIDAQMQIGRAQLEAQRINKKLLLIVGGQWCPSCRVLDQTFQRNPAISELRDSIFIVLHINVSEENDNECALRVYPKATGFPFVYVLDATGTLIGTEDTRDWESGDGYDPHGIESFLRKW
jgi:hypothetical protein